MTRKYLKTLLYLTIFFFLSQFAYALNIVKLSTEYFPNSSVGRALSNADIYVGYPDLDPEIVGNQKTLSVQQEDGTIVEVSQPIHTNAGGVPQYAGSPVTLLVDGDYSIKVLDSNGVQKYYVPSTPYKQYIVAGNYYYPDYSEPDQGVAGPGGNTVTDIMAEVGMATKATIHFSHNSGAATTTYTFTTNTVITDNFNIIIEDGAILDGAGTLTLNGSFKAELYQVFGSSITVVFGPGSVTEAYPEWWGKNTTPGTTDMTDEINACAAAAKTNLIPVKFSSGEYLVTKSLDFTEANKNELVSPREGWLISGSGQRSTIITPNLTEAYPVIDTTGSSWLKMSNMSIYGADVGSQTCGILSAYSSTGGGHWQIFDNVMVRGYFNGGPAFATSTSDQIMLTNCYMAGFSGPGAVFTTSDITGVAYLTPNVDSKFATIAVQGNTKITTRDCYFSTEYAGPATIMDGYENWEDTGSYWACSGTSTTAAHIYAKAGGSSLDFSGIRMETNHSTVDAIGIFVDSTGAGSLRQSIIKGVINQDTNSSPAIKIDTGLVLATSDISIFKTTTNTSPLIYGDIANCILHIGYANHDITNYTTASGGNTIYSSTDSLGNWFKFSNKVLYHNIFYNLTEQKYRYSRVGASETNYGRDFGGIIHQASGYPASDGGGEKVLYTYTIPLFSGPGVAVDVPVFRVTSWGKTAANANAKTIKLYAVWTDDSASTTTDYLMVSNNITGSPNNSTWKIEGVLENMFEHLGSMIIDNIPQTTKTIRTSPFDYAADTMKIEVRSDAALNDVTGYKFIVSY